MPEPGGGEVLLAFDYGLKRIGVASGQSVSATATPRAVIACRQGEPDWQALGRLLERWSPGALVVGLPLTRAGEESDMTSVCRRFARRLHERYRLPVHLVDERYTSREAQDEFVALRKKGALRRRHREQLDAVAAARILEDYLRGERK